MAIAARDLENATPLGTEIAHFREFVRPVEHTADGGTRQLSAFCDQWVPSGAEAERVDILGRLAELAEAPAGPST